MHRARAVPQSISTKSLRKIGPVVRNESANFTCHVAPPAHILIWFYGPSHMNSDVMTFQWVLETYRHSLDCISPFLPPCPRLRPLQSGSQDYGGGANAAPDFYYQYIPVGKKTTPLLMLPRMAEFIQEVWPKTYPPTQTWLLNLCQVYHRDGPPYFGGRLFYKVGKSWRNVFYAINFYCVYHSAGLRRKGTERDMQDFKLKMSLLPDALNSLHGNCIWKSLERQAVSYHYQTCFFDGVRLHKTKYQCPFQLVKWMNGV